MAGRAADASLRFLAPVTALQIVASILFYWFLLDNGYPFFATAIILFYLIALWRHPKVASLGHPRAVYFIAAAASAVAWAFVWITGQLMGATGLGLGPNPPVLILFFGGFMLLASLYHSLAGAGSNGQILFALIAIPAVFFGGQFLLGGAWGNVGGLVGEAGYGVEQAWNTVTAPISEQVAFIQNRVLNPSRNRNLAQLKCAAELLSGGGVFEVASGSTAMSQCVEETLAQNESQAQSEQVTDPVEVQIGDARIEPFSDHVRVGVPLTNTIAYDLQGVPLTIPARNVTTTVYWRYLDKFIADAKQNVGTIPNGDTRLVDFEEREGGAPYFATFATLNGSFTDNALENQLASIQEGEQSPDWVTSRIDNNQLSAGRILFIIQVTDGLSCEDPGGGLETVCEYLRGDDVIGSPLPQVLLQDRSYDVIVEVSYDYEAEAAFTESSRWRSGNQLLEVWTEEAWQDLPFEEREAWRRTKCGEIDRYGQTFTKQRTAALTTPVVPVMYTDCGISLFRDIQQGVETTVPITVSANINEESEVIDSLASFTIDGAETTCHGGTGTRDLGGLTGRLWTDREGVGWTSGSGDTVVIDRSVTVEGQRQTIGCRTSMNLSISMLDQTVYDIPEIG